MVPVVVRLDKAGVCGCGTVVAAGERAGVTRHLGRIVCLSCLAAFLAKPEAEVWSEAAEDEPAEVEPVEVEPVEVEPVEVEPVEDGPVSETPHDVTAPELGTAAELHAPTAVLIPAEVAAPHTDPEAPAATPAVTSPPAVGSRAVEAVAVEAVAMTVPSHRRRTLLPAGLLALKASRGREPGPTGESDATIRALLDAAARAGVLSLHDRRMPGRRARIAHLAFGAAGVYVIDVVRARNASVELRPVDELDPGTQELVVGGRAMTKAVTAAQDRAAVVRSLLDEVELSTVPTIGVVCLVDAAVSTDAPLEVGGVRVVGRTGLRALVEGDGALDEEHRETLHEYLAERLPA